MKIYLFILPILILLNNFSFAQGVPENLTDTEKIYGLSKAWKEADKNFVFFDQIPDLDWDQEYQNFIPKVLETTSTYDYYKVLQSFYSLLNDGHTRVVVPWQLRITQEVNPPFKTELVDGKVFVSEIFNDTLTSRGLMVGMEITKIDDIEVHKYASEMVKPYVFYSTIQDMNIQVYENNLLRGHIDRPIKIENNEGEKIFVSRKMTKSEVETGVFEFEVLENNIGHLKINQFWGDNIISEFDELFPELMKTSKLIIDVSENSGGNSDYAHYILKHLVGEPFNTSRWKSLIYVPAYASWNQTEKWMDNLGSTVEPFEDSLKKYTNPLAVIISEKTYSAGEDFVSAFTSTNRGTTIGRRTAGTTGNPIGFGIPGLGGIQICTKKDYLPNGKEFVGYGIEPDLIVQKTLNDKNLLTKAIELLQN